MAWLAVDNDEKEFVFELEPKRSIDMRYEETIWIRDDPGDHLVELPEGTIEKILGYKLTWEDEAVEI